MDPAVLILIFTVVMLGLSIATTKAAQRAGLHWYAASGVGFFALVLQVIAFVAGGVMGGDEPLVGVAAAVVVGVLMWRGQVMRGRVTTGAR